MVGLGKSGVSAIVVLAIVAASTGAAVATPVVVDAVGVDPDSPLYGLGRLGERIRMTSDEVQMERRWGEYSRMVNAGKGLEYQGILEEFNEKMTSVAPGDTSIKNEIVQWMQEQMPGMGLVELKLAQEFSGKVGEFAKNRGPPAGWDNEAKLLEDLEQQYLNATPEMRENILARLQLIRERLRQMASQFKDQLPPGLERYFAIDNLLVDAGINARIRVGNGRWMPSPENAAEFFNDKLNEFNEQLADVQAKLEGSPENTPGRQAVQMQVEIAVKLRDNAIQASNADNIERAVLLLRTAYVHLDNADKILEHAAEWEPEFQHEWARSRQQWQGPRMGK